MRNGRIENWNIKNCDYFSARWALVLVFLLLMPTFATEQRKKRVMTGSAAKSGAPANLKVTADLAHRLAKFRRVPMPFRTADLSAREQQLVRKLVEACGYWRVSTGGKGIPSGLHWTRSSAP